MSEDIRTAPPLSVPLGPPGLLMTRSAVHRDARGWFKENWRRSQVRFPGEPELVQHNLAFNEVAGTTRGFHAEPWDKLISVAVGKVFGAWVDLRPGPGFGAVATAMLDVGSSVLVPRGVANAYQTLLPHTVYSYLVSQEYDPQTPARSRYVALADPALGIAWPLPLDRAVISDADRHHPPLASVAPLAPPSLLVLGGGGQLGSAFAELGGREPRLLVLPRSEADLERPESLEALDLRDTSTVINAAAFTGVDAAETPEGARRAWAVNAQGTAALARLCARRRVRLVHVSSDYVLDGSSEFAAADEGPRPLNNYGASKAAGEQAALAAGALVVRTAWVYGNGSNFVDSMIRSALEGRRVRVVADQVGRLTPAAEVAKGILRLIDAHAPSGIYHLQGSGEPLSWARIASEIYAAAGSDPDLVEAITSADWAARHPGTAARPPRSVLDLSGTERWGVSTEDQLVVLRDRVQRAVVRAAKLRAREARK